MLRNILGKHLASKKRTTKRERYCQNAIMGGGIGSTSQALPPFEHVLVYWLQRQAITIKAKKLEC